MTGLDRRTMLRATGGAALVGIGGTLAGPAQSEMTQIAPGLFDIGLTNLPLKMVQQHCEQWCWAASIETIFATWGFRAPQEALVEYFLGRQPNGALVCAPASDTLMLNAVSATLREDATGRLFRGGYFLAKDDTTNPANHAWWDILVTELRNGRPLLAAYRTGPNTGHAVVVTHVRVQYYNQPGRRPDLIAMTVRDPWPQSPNRRQLTLNQVLNLRFIAAVNVKYI